MLKGRNAHVCHFVADDSRSMQKFICLRANVMLRDQCEVFCELSLCFVLPFFSDYAHSDFIM